MKHPKILLTGLTSIDALESFYPAIRASCEDTNLCVPTNIDDSSFALTAGVIQLICYWQRKCPLGRIQTYIKSADEIDNFVKQDHGFVCGLLSTSIMDKNENDISAVCYKASQVRLQQMKTTTEDRIAELRHGPKICLLCADETTKSRILSLYYTDQKRSLKSRASFSILAQNILKETANFDTTRRRCALMSS